jgi:hypothetical protein
MSTVLWLHDRTITKHETMHENETKEIKIFNFDGKLMREKSGKSSPPQI